VGFKKLQKNGGKMVECKFFAHSAFMFVGQEENADVCYPYGRD
jgi:hypothetical protein